MPALVLYLWVVAGVLASLLLPIIWKAAFPDTPLPQGFGPVARKLWPEVKPYCSIAILSLLIALVSFAIVKSSGGQFSHW